ncbi:hypothetical protein AZA_29454 [Nitrospirillum viridazoti Y2]|nr:hypothetical protein AZA_29454 [Nitrospirillum amazonense Y2]
MIDRLPNSSVGKRTGGKVSSRPKGRAVVGGYHLRSWAGVRLTGTPGNSQRRQAAGQPQRTAEAGLLPGKTGRRRLDGAHIGEDAQHP